jgi:hypothetical protein
MAGSFCKSVGQKTRETDCGNNAIHLHPSPVTFTPACGASESSWVVETLNERLGAVPRYILISYTNKQFDATRSEGRHLLEKTAQSLAQEPYCEDFWMDFQCREQELLTSEVNRIADVVQGASQFIAILHTSLQEGSV